MRLDTATAVALGAGGRTVACALEDAKRVDVFALPARVGDKPSLKREFSVATHGMPVRIMRFASRPGSGGVFLTSAEQPDTTIRAWTPRGDVAGFAQTNQVIHYDMALSSDGRFAAVAAFAADVKVLAVEWAKGDDARGPTRLTHVMSLKGHKSAVRGVAFAAARPAVVVTASKDGTWRMWDIDGAPFCIHIPRLSTPLLRSAVPSP